MTTIKVVHIDNLDVGLKVHLGNYMTYLQEQGYHLSAVCPPGRWLKQDTSILNDIPVKIIPFEPSITPWVDLKSLLRLVSYFRRERFDIVHTHTVKPGLLGRLAARLAGVPVIIHTVHGFYLSKNMSPATYKFFVGIERFGAACSHAILSQNREDIDTAIREKICPPEKISYLGNGIDMSLFQPELVAPEQQAALRESLSIPESTPVVAYMARLVQEKGIMIFLEAARMLKSQGIQARYLIVGSPQKDKKSSIQPEEALREFGLEQDAILLGYRDDIPALLSLVDMVVLPSRGEGIPRIVMEAAAMGKPAIVSRVRGNTEAVEDGRTGIHVDRNPEAVASAIARLIADPSLAAQMGQHARQRALTHFDERLFFWKTDLEYRRLLSARLGMDANSLLKPVPVVQGL